MLIAGCNKASIDSSNQQILDKDILSAQRLFEEEVVHQATFSTRSTENTNRPTHLFQLGTIAPEWSDAERLFNKKSASKYVEVPLTTTYRYRVLQSSPDEKKARKVKVYQELLVLPDSKNARDGVFLVFYIATNKYIKWNKGILNYRFNNSGNMNKYSGLKIYTDLEGRLIRVNKYLDGKKTSGVFVPSYLSENKRGLLNAYLKEQFKNMRFQYGIRIAPPTRSWEDDDHWSYSDWDQDPNDDGHYYAPEDELDGGYCGSYDYFWFQDNGYDWGDDGNSDYYDPDDGNGYGDWNDDYGSSYGDNQGNKDVDYGNKKDQKKLDTSKAKKKYKGYNSERDCKQVADTVMIALGKTPKGCNRVTLTTTETIRIDGKEYGKAVRNDTDLIPVIQTITGLLDKGDPVMVGIDYGLGPLGRNDGVIDHFVVIYGYRIIDEITIQFFYVETAYGNSDLAYGEANVLTYVYGDDYIHGYHWKHPEYYYNVTQIRKD